MLFRSEIRCQIFFYYAGILRRALLIFLKNSVLICISVTNCLKVHCKKVYFAIFLSGGFATMAVINPLDWKLANRTSVCTVWYCFTSQLADKCQIVHEYDQNSHQNCSSLGAVKQFKSRSSNLRRRVLLYYSLLKSQCDRNFNLCLQIFQTITK